MATLINIPDEVELAVMAGLDSFKAGRGFDDVPAEYGEDTPEEEAWMVGWLSGNNGWVVEF